MNINLTLIGQSITFLVFVWFCMKFVWPPIMRALEQRKKQIADGLAAAERGKREQHLAEERATEMLRETKGQAADIIAKAEKRAGEIVEEAKVDARTEGERLVTAARSEIDQEVNQARETLRAQVAAVVVAGAAQVLEREIDESKHAELMDKLAAQI